MALPPIRGPQAALPKEWWDGEGWDPTVHLLQGLLTRPQRAFHPKHPLSFQLSLSPDLTYLHLPSSLQGRITARGQISEIWTMGRLRKVAMRSRWHFQRTGARQPINTPLPGSLYPRHPLMLCRLCTAGLPPHLASSVTRVGLTHSRLSWQLMSHPALVISI